MVDRAEGIGDPVLAAVADQQHVDLAELRVAVRAASRALSAPRLGHLARLPVAAPWIDQGTRCSSRQKTARRSPAGS